MIPDIELRLFCLIAFSRNNLDTPTLHLAPCAQSSLFGSYFITVSCWPWVVIGIGITSVAHNVISNVQRNALCLWIDTRVLDHLLRT